MADATTIIQVPATAAGVQQTLESITRQLKEMREAVEQTAAPFKELTRLLGSLGEIGGIAITAEQIREVIERIGESIEKAAEAGEHAVKLSNVVGMSAEAYNTPVRAIQARWRQRRLADPDVPPTGTSDLDGEGQSYQLPGGSVSRAVQSHDGEPRGIRAHEAGGETPDAARSL